MLRSLVELIRARSRKVDLLFRMGGEKFLLLLPDTRCDEAHVIAEHLRAAVAQAPLGDARPVTVSIGVSELAAGDAMQDWIARAGQALARAKDEGRNRVV